METRIVSLLENDAAISALVSDRIYPNAVPETGSVPAIIYTMISDNREKDFDGSNEIIKQRLQLSVWSKSYATSKQITKEIIRLFDSYKGEYDGIKFHSIFLENAVDLFDHDTNQSGNNVDLIINYEEL